MEMPRPTDAHRRLEQFAGHWVGEEIMHPSPWDPEGGKAEGHMQSRRALDGFAAIDDYEQRRGGQVTFRGHGVHSYDTQQQCYVLHWWDSMGMPANVFRGNFTGDVLTMTCVDAQGHSRMTYDLSQPGQLRSKLEMSPDGKEWKVFMESSYRRRD